MFLKREKTTDGLQLITEALRTPKQQSVTSAPDSSDVVVKVLQSFIQAREQIYRVKSNYKMQTFHQQNGLETRRELAKVQRFDI